MSEWIKIENGNLPQYGQDVLLYMTSSLNKNIGKVIIGKRMPSDADKISWVHMTTKAHYQDGNCLGISPYLSEVPLPVTHWKPIGALPKFT